MGSEFATKSRPMSVASTKPAKAPSPFGRDVARLTGQPPANETRALLGPRFGWAINKVPVHANVLAAKLDVGSPGDQAEQQADRMADQVMGAPQPIASVQAADNPILQRHAAGHTAPATAPPIVHDVLRSPGQPLGAETRAFMEPRFGHDFGQVRIHTDGKAATSADSMGALGYTVGRHIAFGARQYNPETGPGRWLIAHELTHVVQQQLSGLLGVQKKPLKTVPPKPLSYGATGFTIPPPRQPFTLQDAQNFVERRKKEIPPALTKGDVKGAVVGSVAEIFLWYILASVASRDLWGTENNLIAAIGWAPSASATSAPAGSAPRATQAPTAAVRVRIDEMGVGTAELVSSQPVAAVKTFADVAAAKSGLVALYGLKSVVDGDATWTLDNLNIVSGAFDLLPASDKAALKGVDLKRVAVIDATHSAQFSSETAAVEKTTTAASQTATLEVANSTFSSDATLFVGGAQPLPRSSQTIIHEVGHAVANKVTRAASLANATALVASNQAIEKSNLAIDARNAAVDEFNALAGEFNKIAKDLNAAKSAKAKDQSRITSLEADLKAKQAEVDAKRKVVDGLTKDQKAKQAVSTQAKDVSSKAKQVEAATHVPLSAVKAGMTAMKSLGTTSGTALKMAQAGVKSFNPQDNGDSLAYRQAVEAVSAELTTFASAVEAETADANTQDESLEAAVSTRDTEKRNLITAAPANPALAGFASVEAAQTAWGTAVKIQARLAKRTLREQHFVDMVNANRIKPFTKYAKDNWPHKPGEFFAEAYSLWRTDPEFLKTNAKPMFDWFEAGHHRD